MAGTNSSPWVRFHVFGLVICLCALTLFPAVVDVARLVLEQASPASQQVDRSLLTDQSLSRITSLLINSLIVALGSACVATLLGVLLAGLLVFGSSTQRSLVMTIILLVGTLPTIVLAAGWQGAFGWPRLNEGISTWTVGLDRWLTVILIHGISATILVTLLFAGSLNRLRNAALDVSLLSASPLTIWQNALLPSLKSTWLLAGLIAGQQILTDMTVTDLYRIRTFAEEVYIEYRTASGAPVASLVSIALAASIAGMLVLLRQTIDWRNLFEQPHPGHRVLVHHPGFWAALLSMIVLVMIPLAGIVSHLGRQATVLSSNPGTSQMDSEQSRNPNQFVRPTLDQDWKPSTALRALSQAWQTDRWTLWRTLGIALTTALASITLGSWMSWQLRRPTRSTTLVWFLLGWLFFTPGPVLSLGLLSSLEQIMIWLRVGSYLDLRDSWLLIVLGQMIRVLPIVTAFFAIMFSRRNRGAIEQDQLAGQPDVRTYWRCVQAIGWPTLMGATLLSLLWCAGEMPMTHLLAPPGCDVIGPRIFELLHAGSVNQVSALCMMLSASLILIASVTQLALPLLTRPS